MQFMGNLSPETLGEIIQKGDTKDLQKLMQKLPEEEKYNIFKRTHSKAGIKLLQAQPANL